MNFVDSVLEIIKQFGPALGALLIVYFRDRAVDEKNKARLSDLEKILMENKANVEKEVAGLDSDAIIDKLAPGPGGESK